MANEQVGVKNECGIEAQIAQLSVEDVTVRHRREKKELQAKIQALKKSAPKNDKKKRKEIMEEVARLESQMDEKHQSELKAAVLVEENIEFSLVGNRKNSVQSTTDSEGSTFGLPQQQQQQQQQQINGQEVREKRVSKAQKRREKKAREAREREREISDELRKTQPEKEPKIVELKQIEEILAKLHLALYETSSDGNCLYNAVRHQLIIKGMHVYTVAELRNETAKYIRAHKDALICYMTNPETNELLNDAEFEEYCDAVRDTAAWGGQVELKALSTFLSVPIEVLQATGPPTTFGADEFSEPKLIITYHRFMYQMGEHYNSTIAAANDVDDDDDIDGDTKTKHQKQQYHH